MVTILSFYHYIPATYDLLTLFLFIYVPTILLARWMCRWREFVGLSFRGKHPEGGLGYDRTVLYFLHALDPAALLNLSMTLP